MVLLSLLVAARAASSQADCHECARAATVLALSTLLLDAAVLLQRHGADTDAKTPLASEGVASRASRPAALRQQ